MQDRTASGVEPEPANLPAVPLKLTASRKRIGFVCSGGGHLTEALVLAERFADADCFFLTHDQDLPVRCCTIPRFWHRPYLLPYCLLKTFWCLLRERPSALISTGAETALLAFPFAKIFLRAKLIYIECGAQVYKPSWTGRLVRRMCNLFFVQWPDLLKYYPNAEYAGALIE